MSSPSLKAMSDLSKAPVQQTISSQKIITEFLGTFAFTYIGIWATIGFDINILTKNALSLAHALGLMTFTWFGFKTSGSHYNPAITIALVVVNKIDWTTALFYIIAQLLGGIVSAGFVFIQASDSVLAQIKDKSVLGIPTPGSNNYEINGLWGESFGTFFIMYVYMAVFMDKVGTGGKDIGGAAMGIVLYLVMNTIGEISGGGCNPARSLGPAIVAGHNNSNLFILIIGPIIGSVLGAIIYASVFIDEEEDLKEIEEERINRLNNDPGIELQ